MLFSAVLDANVLFPNALRDTLLRLGATGLYRPLWSDRILAEVRTAVLRARPDVDPARFDRTLDLMRTHFPDATVRDFDHLEAAMVAHPKDRHVLARRWSRGPSSSRRRLPGGTGIRRCRGTRCWTCS